MAAEDDTLDAHRYRWDVFLSFKVNDTSQDFTDKLYNELMLHVIRVFRDDKVIERGDDILSTRLAAIKDSAAAIIVISMNYANSKRCLEELAEICDCGRLIIPVFYGVDPSDVRSQKNSFEVDFLKHEREVAAEKVERWRNAMKRVSNISGWDLRSREESQLIKELVKKMLKELCNTPMRATKYPVGINDRLEILLRKLDVKVHDVRVVGFFGMGGIGKTTLAKVLYNKLIVHFKRRCFLSNIREESQKINGLESLQRKLVADLNSNAPTIFDTKRGINYIKEAAYNDPILLVLDDIDSSNQLDMLAGRKEWFHTGSRIIITSRNKEIFLKNAVDNIFEVEKLSTYESVQLFSYHAFGREQPDEIFMEVSKQIVSLTMGLPLALEIFGSLLFYKRRMTEWHDTLEKLKRVRPGDLQDLLEISYISLGDQERCIFLDIACFFSYTDIKMEDVIDIFRGCGFSAESVFTNLAAKSLIKIIDNNVLWMHDQVRDMGREIVRRESDIDAGQRSRLWDRDEILKVLNNRKGTGSIEGITIDFTKKHKPIFGKTYPIEYRKRSLFGFDNLKKLYQGDQQDDETLCTEAFKSMVNLRLLQINKAQLNGNFALMPSKLKWLQWKGCPLKCLPFEFQFNDITVLDLSESEISHIWCHKWWKLYGEKIGKNMRVLNLYACRDLQELPDISGLGLEKLILEHCSSLVRIHKSIGNMSKLTFLNMNGCKNLVKFPNDVSGLKCLEKLILSGCSKLRDLPEDISGLKSLRELLVDRTAIVKLPESLFLLTNLEVLNLNDCLYLTQLPTAVGNLSSLKELSLNGSAFCDIPDSLGKLKNLEILYLQNCCSLALLPETIGDLMSLTSLYLQFSSINELPASIGSLCKLKFLMMTNCKNVCYLPHSIGGLSSLVSLGLRGSSIHEIPSQIRSLDALQKLDIGSCQSLKYLPESLGNMLNLKNLILTDLTIKELPESIGLLERLQILNLNYCKQLERLPSSMKKLQSLHTLQMRDTSVTELPVDIGMLSNLRILKMRKNDKPGIKANDVILPESFFHLDKLEELDAYAFKISGRISDDFGNLSSLETLNLSRNDISSLPYSLKGLSLLKKLLLAHCKELKSLPPLPSNLITLNVGNCTSLEIMPDISHLKGLQELELTNCNKVIDIPGFENLQSLKRLYAGGCNACLLVLKTRISKIALRTLRYLCVPGNKIPTWFAHEIPNYSHPKNRELKAVIIGVVVSLDQNGHDTFRNEIPAIVDIQARIIRRNEPIVTTTLRLLGVPNTDEDQLYMCRFHDFSNLVLILEEGDKLQVIMRQPTCFQGIKLKKHGIQLVFENDDDYENCDDALFSDESKQSISKRLSNFFNSL